MVLLMNERDQASIIEVEHLHSGTSGHRQVLARGRHEHGVDLAGQGRHVLPGVGRGKISLAAHRVACQLILPPPRRRIPDRRLQRQRQVVSGIVCEKAGKEISSPHVGLRCRILVLNDDGLKRAGALTFEFQGEPACRYWEHRSP